MELQSKDHLDRLLKDEKRLLVLHFWTSWSEPCRHINEALNELSKNSNHCLFVKVEAETFSEVSLEYKIIAVPTVLFLKDGQVVDRVDGAHLPDIARKAQSLSSKFFTVGDSASISNQDHLNDRLKSLTTATPCVLFMKGSPEHPRCGFSRQIVTILNELNADFSSFDVLSDNEVREGIKKYSNWPTFPQLYLNGELIGGLDIAKEMKESGELAKLLPTVKSIEEKLQLLVSNSPIMLFMKGSPDNPKCGFSRAICDILKAVNAEFNSYDVLQDETVRQALKTFSNWPTFPQLYINQSFIGGLDIVKELHDSGQLSALLEPKS